jgi:hypothetical protein
MGTLGVGMNPRSPNTVVYTAVAGVSARETEAKLTSSSRCQEPEMARLVDVECVADGRAEVVRDVGTGGTAQGDNEGRPPKKDRDSEDLA